MMTRTLPRIVPALLSLGLLPALAFAAFDDVTLTGSSNTVFSINGITLNVVGTSAKLNQATAGTDTLVVKLQPGSVVAISAPNRNTLSHNANTSFVTRDACESDQSALTLFYPDTQSGTLTVTITPSSTTCGASGSSSGSAGGGGPVASGGGGGGGGGSASPAPAPAPTPTPTPAASAAFTRVLRVGSSGDDVVALQTFLESNGYLVIPAGVAKGYFGSLTKKAVAALQESIGFEPVGIVGPLTRAYLNAQ